ncbi:neuropeptide y receptor type 1 [Plakobranchus ocellatus]|uniref:Neuropeptide y receptor type 1 n=1 Tax=Plakobranchus ocellatus TaxID=259542 RepID=A0AAV3ZD52_9GAST|nr:neuropeptide y receptor type 1 [Plakobranchus ocellatus]
MDGTSEDPSNSWNISDAEAQHYIDLVQADTTKIVIPIITFLIFLAILGAVGNALVLLVYYRGFKKGATRVLILFIAAVDLFSCILVIPGEVYDMFHLWDWTNTGVCRARMLVSGTSTVASALALLWVAIVRYRKVCHPFGWQVGSRHARIATVAVLLFSILAASPLAVVNGRQTKPIPSSYTKDAQYPLAIDTQSQEDGVTFSPENHTRNIGDIYATKTNESQIGTSTYDEIISTTKMVTGITANPNNTLIVYGHECSTDDAYRDTIWPLVATGILLILFIASAASLCTMYSLIGRKAWRHRKRFQVQQIGSSGDEVSSDGVALKVFRMLSSKRKKPSKSTASSDSAGTAHTKSSSFSATTSSSQKEENSFNEAVLVSTAASTGMPNQTGEPGSSTEPRGLSKEASSESNGAVGSFKLKEDGEKHGKENMLEKGDSQLASYSKNNTSTDIENCSSGAPTSKLTVSHKDSQQSFGDSDSSKEPQKTATTNQKRKISAGSRKFVEINLDSKPLSNDSSSEELSDTDEGRKKILANRKQSRSLLQNIVQKSMHKKNSTTSKDSRKQSTASKKSQSGKTKRPELLNRTTIMLFCISAVYIVGYLSHLAMIFFKVGAPETFDMLGFFGKSAWNFFLRLYYVNCAANPVVYSLCDLNFRKNCLALFKGK